MSAVIELGTLSNVEQPESGAVVKADIVTTTYVLRGKTTALAAVQPAKGSAYGGGVVRKSELRPGRGNLGTLTIEVGADDTGGTVELSVRYEILWQQLEKPILSHPLFAADAEAVAKWAESEDRAKTYDALPSEQKSVAERILKGIESYLVWSPVLTKTSTYSNRPTTGGCGVREAPPSAAVPPSGYEWLKTADQAVQQDDGNWVRTQQWTGADEWDAVLYPAPKSP